MNKDKKKMRNSKYTREFRDSSVQLVINSDESTAKIAKDLDVNEKTLYNWVREYQVPLESIKKVIIFLSPYVRRVVQTYDINSYKE